MSAVFSGTVQGSFTSNGSAKILQIREGIDWINVYNTTQMAANQTTAKGVQYYWQFGFPQGAMIAYFKSNAANAANLSQYLTSGGFSIVNNTINTPGPLTAITSISSASPPVVTVTSSTSTLSNGSIARLYNVTSDLQLGGLDFTVGSVTANTSFTLAYMSSAAVAAGTGGNFAVIPYDPYFYPPVRIIAAIDVATAAGCVAAAGSPALAANQAIITLTVTHAFTIGQVVKFVIPTVTSAAYGMTQLNNVQGTIISVGDTSSTAAGATTNTIRVNVDVSSFGTFAWPASSDPVHTPAQVVPVGENSAQAILSGSNFIGDSEVNQGFLGISLAGGAGSPGGANNDVIYWVAGKSFSGGL